MVTSLAIFNLVPVGFYAVVYVLKIKKRRRIQDLLHISKNVNYIQFIIAPILTISFFRVFLFVISPGIDAIIILSLIGFWVLNNFEKTKKFITPLNESEFKLKFRRNFLIFAIIGTILATPVMVDRMFFRNNYASTISYNFGNQSDINATSSIEHRDFTSLFGTKFDPYSFKDSISETFEYYEIITTVENGRLLLNPLDHIFFGYKFESVSYDPGFTLQYNLVADDDWDTNGNITDLILVNPNNDVIFTYEESPNRIFDYYLYFNSSYNSSRLNSTHIAFDFPILFIGISINYDDYSSLIRKNMWIVMDLNYELVLAILQDKGWYVA